MNSATNTQPREDFLHLLGKELILKQTSYYFNLEVNLGWKPTPIDHKKLLVILCLNVLVLLVFDS